MDTEQYIQENLSDRIAQVELDSILELTQAINNNLPEDVLYSVFRDAMMSRLILKGLALFVKYDDWHCRVKFGTKKDYSNIILPDEIQSINDIVFLDGSQTFEGFEEFDCLIPVRHKTDQLAFVFVDRIDHLEHHFLILKFIQTYANILMVAIENKRLAARRLEQETYKRELNIARSVQQGLFPKHLPDTDAVQIHATYLPHKTVGGDYYDYLSVNEHQFLVCMADVSGKGVPAAILMSNFQASLRVMVRHKFSFIEIIHELNWLIKQNARGDSFITAFIAVFDTEKNVLVYVNAGHNPPILINKGEVKSLDVGTTLLGAFDELPFLKIGMAYLNPGDFLVTYTDGLTETANELEEEYGTERLADFACQNKDLPAEDFHRLLIESLYNFKGAEETFDDITVLTCKRL